jgi:PAS domain S-box-containing protein
MAAGSIGGRLDHDMPDAPSIDARTVPRPSRTRLWLGSAATLVAVWVAVRLTGGLPDPLAYFGFIAVALAVLAGGWRAGLVSGLAAGLLLGPLAPTNPAASIGPLGPLDWTVRLGAFTIAGATTGWLWDEAQRLTQALEREAGRRRADALAHASEERLRQTIEASADGVLVFDERARLVLANPAAERIIGRGRDELLGRMAADLVESMGGVLEGSPLGDPRGDGEVSLIRPDGTRVLVRVSVNPLAGDEGPLGGTAVTIHDATAERSLAEEHSVRVQLLDEAARYAVGAASAAAAGEWLLAQLSSAWSLVAAAIYLLEADTTNRLAAWSPLEFGEPRARRGGTGPAAPRAPAGHAGESAAAPRPGRPRAAGGAAPGGRRAGRHPARRRPPRPRTVERSPAR